MTIFFGIVLSLASRPAAGNDRIAHSPWHAVLWILGVGLVILGCWRKEDSSEYGGLDRQDIFLIGLFFIISFILRVAYLDVLPYSLTGDEGETGLYGLQFVEGLRNNLLDMGWNEFPALYFWLVSLAQRILGPTISAIRIVSVIGGSLSVIAVYWTSRQMFSRTHAFFAAAFLAGMHFHILFSRVAVNNIWDGLFLVLMIGGLWVAWRYNLRWSFILVGAAIGLSQFFYTTGHLIPVYTLLFVILLYFSSREKGRLPGIVAMALVALALVLPLGLYWLDNLHELIIPMRRVTLLSSVSIENYVNQTGQSALFLFGEQLKTTVLGLISEPIQGLYRPSTPMLLPISGMLFVTGCVISLVRFRNPRYSILLIGLLGPIFAGALSVEAPNSQRLLFTTPLAAILVGIALAEFVYLLQVAWPRQRSFISIIPITILAVIIAHSLSFFFSEAMPDQRFSDRGGLIAREISEFLKDKPAGTDVYIVGPAEIGFYSIPSLPYLSPHVNGYDLFWPLENEQELPHPSENLILLFQPLTDDYYSEIRAFYPNAKLEAVFDRTNMILFRALTFRQ